MNQEIAELNKNNHVSQTIEPGQRDYNLSYEENNESNLDDEPEKRPNIKKEVSVTKKIFTDSSVRGNEPYINTTVTTTDVLQKRVASTVLPKPVVREGFAFSAYLGHVVQNLNNGHTVKCDQVLLNEGNAYNNK